jgi:hypothetical protein
MFHYARGLLPAEIWNAGSQQSLTASGEKYRLFREMRLTAKGGSFPANDTEQ